MKRLALVLAATLASGTFTLASAQVTKCGDEFGKWVCRTEQPQQQPDIFGAGQRAYVDTQRQMEAAQAQRAAAQAQRQAAAQQAQRSNLEAAVAAAVREGRCADAKDIALANSDFTLADQAQRLCTPAK